MKREIKKIGNSTGLILPKELLARLGLSQGDHVLITEGPDGLKISRYVPDMEKGLELVRR